MATHYTYKGQPIDMSAMLMMNEHAIALGNANLNARGDVLGRGGKIVQTSEEITEEYYRQQTLQDTIMVNEAPALAEAVAEPVMEEFDPSLLTGFDDTPLEPQEPAKPKRRRKAPAAEE